MKRDANQTPIDVYAIGNALVDTEYTVDERFLRDQNLEKGHMTLIDEVRLTALMQSLEERPAKRECGGSAANTALAVSGFGGRAFYSCKVAGDEPGAHFLKGMREAGVGTVRHDGNAEGKTGHCLVMVTPDAERTMTTFLGISEQLGISEVNDEALGQARFLYIEGYLASSPTGSQAASHARTLAESANVATALTLSDASMVLYFRESLTRMLGNGVDFLFCNEEEALSWAKTDRLDVAAQELKDLARSVTITLGAKGAYVRDQQHIKQVPSFPVQPIDTNGAGDMFAGACLYGLTHSMPLEQAAHFGNFAAAKLVTHFGARLPLPEYADLAKQFRKRA